MADFFTQNITIIFFFYGLAFFCMGLAIFLERQHANGLSFTQALGSLAAFGVIHGSHEWFEMFLLMPEVKIFSLLPGNLVFTCRIVLLSTSFVFLLAFGLRLILGENRIKLVLLVIFFSVILWLSGLGWISISLQDVASSRVAMDVFTRYSLAVSGALLAAWGLLLEYRRLRDSGYREYALDVAFAAGALVIYGLIGQVFASPSRIFPSTFLNATVFLKYMGFPVQVLRAVMASLMAIFIIRSMRLIKKENERRLAALHERQLLEQRRLEELRAELLHRTVKAQEAERQRIAQELHDEIGQTLTALALGLRALTENIPKFPDRAIQQARHLEKLASSGIIELQRLVSGLHPSHLDDLGLLAAIRWYTNDVSQHFGLNINLTSQGHVPDLNEETRTVLFRIVQEAITNIVRHANTESASVQIIYQGSKLTLSIEDQGSGFNVDRMLQGGQNQECWGLLGMQERATLIGGVCTIQSQPDKGTRVEVELDLESEAESG